MRGFLVFLLVILGLAGSVVLFVEGPIDYELVTVGLPGAAGDPRVIDHRTPHAPGPIRHPRENVGLVLSRYRIGTYPVTVDEYVRFLNAIAAQDAQGYYDTRFAEDYWHEASPTPGQTRRTLFPKQIRRLGVAGSYTYEAFDDTGRQPMAKVGPRRAFAFANWMHNGQPSGAEDPTTTEDGCYEMTALPVPPRKQSCAFWIPSLDELHKAAFCEPEGEVCVWRTWPAQPARESYIDVRLPGGITYINAPVGGRPPDAPPGSYAICPYNAGLASPASCPPESRGGPDRVIDVDAIDSPSPWGAQSMAGNTFQATDTAIVPEFPASVFAAGSDIAHGREDASAWVITTAPFGCRSCATSFRLAAPAKSGSGCGIGFEVAPALFGAAMLKKRKTQCRS